MNDLKKLQENVSEKMSKKLDLDLWERIIKRFAEFASECDECKRLELQYQDEIKDLLAKQDNILKADINKFHSLKSEVVTHLEKQHNLVPPDHYLGVYMSLGLSLGLLFGLVVFDNVGIGLPLGLAVGVAIGSGKDKDAKKQGLVI